MHARRRGGEWLVRIEDIDPPRAQPGAAAGILATLEAYALHWDRAVLYQSTRIEVYREHARTLLQRKLAFHCACSRATLRGQDAYPGTCRTLSPPRGATAVRVRVDDRPERFTDSLQGELAYRLDRLFGDYIVWRRDRLPAYHLAVVVDDAAQSVTDVVRGVDLLDSTAAHLHLQRALGFAAPRYSHVPVIVDAAGRKLSKQTGARPVIAGNAAATAAATLRWLGADVPRELHGAPPAELWRWALDGWRIETLRGVRQRSDHACSNGSAPGDPLRAPSP